MVAREPLSFEARSVLKVAAQNIGVALLYFLAAVLCLDLAVVGGNVSPVWPATGIAIAAVYLGGYRVAPGVFLGGLLAEIYTDAPWIVCAGAPIANILEPVVAVGLLRHFSRKGPLFATARGVAEYFACAGVLATAVSATLGVASMCAGGLGEWSEYPFLWSTWWLGNVMGAVVVGPVILVFAQQVLAQPSRASWPRGRRAEAAALLGVLLVVSAFIFGWVVPFANWHDNSSISIFCMPLVIWAALRFEQCGSVIATLIICTIAILATVCGRGPFVVANPIWSLLLLQAFMGVVAMTGLALAAVESERKRANAALKESHDHLERKVARRTDQLRLAKEAAEEANRAKSGFLANMSHEIRTPMNGIIGMAELLANSPLDQEQRDYLRMARQSADALLRLLNDILDFSKIEAGKLELESVELSLRNCIGQMAQTLAIRAAEKNLELACRIAPDLPDGLIGDPGRLRQILINLAGNAIKFTSEGEVVIEVDEESRTEQEITLHFSVRDTGEGIPREKLARIFEAFTQADSSTTRRHGGTGLGLTICEQLVHLMKGRIWVESQLGVGSTFHFTAVFGMQSPALASQPAELSSLSGMRVLIVDDNATNRRILQEILASWRMKPTAVESAEAGLEEMRRAVIAGEPFRLLLLDLMMPMVDGFELAKRVRLDADFNDCSLIMISSAARPGDAEQCRKLGVARYLTKPVVQADLLETLLGVIGARVVNEVFAGTPSAEPAEVRAGRSILLVEDGLVNQQVALGLLRKRGHDVVVATDGGEAIAALERQSFDIVLMDVQMPGMDGYEATRFIRQKERQSGQHTPIVAMTASAMKGDRELCLEAGMDGYLSKPIDPQELYRAIDEFAGDGSAKGE